MDKDDEMKDEKGKDEKDLNRSVKIHDFVDDSEIPTTYSSLVSERLKKREKNILGTLEYMLEDQIRFTVRIFADCMEKEDMERFLEGYSEYLLEEEMREFIGDFVPKYTAYAVSELEAKKAEADDFEPDHLTGEELQEMAIKEKWPKLAKKPEAFSELRLRREIAKIALCVRPYMLSDPGWNESLLEYSLYFEIQEKLTKMKKEELHEIVKEVGSIIAKADGERDIAAKEKILKEMRGKVLHFAGMEGTVEELLGLPMERYPRESPKGWDLAEFRNNLEKMSARELQLSALAYIEILTLEEMEEFSRPFFKKYSSFSDMDREGLIEFICALVYIIGDRELLNFYERYTKGKMMVAKSIATSTWNLLPKDEKLQYLREDNAEMDLALMARHISRIYISGKLSLLYNYDYQIDLVKDQSYMKLQAHLVQEVGSRDDGVPLKELNDRVTVAMIDVVTSREGMREKFASLRDEIDSFLDPGEENNTGF